MSNLEDCLKVLYVINSLDYFARRVSIRLSKTLSYEDARQELICGLLKSMPGYDSSRSGVGTYAVNVIRTVAHNLMVYKKFIEYEEYEMTTAYIDYYTTSGVELSHESRVVNRILLDNIEKELLKPSYHKSANKVVHMMRRGLSQSGCARKLGCTKQFITHIFKKHIKEAVKNLGLD